MQCEELLFHKQIPSFANKKTSLVKKHRKMFFCLVASVGKEKGFEIPCCCVYVGLSLVIDHMDATLCLINHNLCLGVTDL